MRVSTKRRPAVFRTPAASSLIARRSETAIRERVPWQIEIKEKILALVLLIGKNPYPYILIAVGMSRRLLKFLKRSLRIEIYAASGI